MRTRIRTKRYWYFITQDFMGDKMELTPRLPLSAGLSEPKVNRICVAPTVGHCMSAVRLFCSDPVYVYRTIRRVYAEKAWSVGDSPITHEHFLRRTSKFEFVSVISPGWIKRHERKGNFDDRGFCVGENGYADQKSQSERVIRAVVKLDPRLGIISQSDTRFHFKDEQKLLGKEWPKKTPWNDMNTRDYVLEVLGLENNSLICLELIGTGVSLPYNPAVVCRVRE